MKAKTVCGASTLGFLLALILPTTCLKLTTLQVKPELLTKDSIMADKSNSTIRRTGRPTTEVVSGASSQSRINLSTNANITASYTVNTTECDRSKQTGIVIMIGFNHFGFLKSNSLMQTTLDIMKKVQSEGALVRLVIDDLAPINIAPISFGKKDWVLTSMIRKLRVDTFSPVRSWEMNIFGFLFVDETIDFSDPVLMREMRRVLFHGIHLYMVIIGRDVNMAVINKYLVTPEQVINIPSYDALHSSLPLKLTEKLCVRQSKSKIDIA